MARHSMYPTTAHSISLVAQRVIRFRFWSAVLMSVLATVTLAIAITTPPRSGPFCAGACVTYPYTDVAAFFPRDYLWMFPGMLVTPMFVVCMACIYDYATAEKKLLSMIGVLFALLAAGAITIDYTIQLTVIQPSLLHGETDGLSLISQYNPHGIFIALENLGYIMMSVAFLFAGAVFSGQERVERALRWLFIISFGLAIGALLVLSLLYGNNLDYRFEVIIILINYLALIIAGVLLSIVFRRGGRNDPAS